MEKTAAAIALTLADELLADLELGRIPLANCYMKACRLARLLGDSVYLQLFQYELSGYPSTPNGVAPDVWALCLKAGRVSKEIDEETKKEKETAYVQSIEQLESSVENMRTRLEFSRPQPVSITSANPSQYVHTPVRNLQLESNLSNNLQAYIGKISSRRTFIYSYCLDRLFELRVSSAAEDIFEKYRRRVDVLLREVVPGELRRLDSIAANMRSENLEDWANAVHSCRRLLQSIADELYPPSDGTTKSKSGKDVKIGKDNYINRLILFCEKRSDSKSFTKIIGSELAFMGDRLDAAFGAAQKGSHTDVSYEEAERYVIHSYLLIGDILHLNVEMEDHGLENLTDKNNLHSISEFNPKQSLGLQKDEVLSVDETKSQI